MTRVRVSIFVSGLIVGIGVALLLDRLLVTHACPEYTYVNAPILCHDPRTLSKLPYTRFEQQLQKFADAKKVSGEEVSIYFRDLKNGPIFGVNEDTAFAPGERLRLPLAFAYLRYQIENPDALLTAVRYSTTTLPSDVDVSGTSLKVGEIYTLKELLYNMLVNSDRLSYYLLLHTFEQKVPDGKKELALAYQELGIREPENPDLDNTSTRVYSALFRILYNASYLTADQSDMVLDWLTHTDPHSDLVKPLPVHIQVSHRLQPRALQGGVMQLFDCGIVYYPNNPYVLCLMARGKDVEDLHATLEHISELVYDEVNSRKL